MTTLEMILAILTALSGIGNLTQWVNLRALRQKSKYEAEDVHIEVLKKTIELQADEINRLQERVRILEERSKEREADFEAKVKVLQEMITLGVRS